ncbi:uncharacterized protein BDCG_17106 [Blastomyces dermatitidis ER-3]|uniref:Uncharacterized protein n=1 Tax=Ajellomyces dermatitidis (strain ER-3 / ATCC MYA-2586) TaxID=559297 RepID=A0ABX2VWG9_AJEDR|nr:uncharacterized protein BDCG_17106 [Blastomyces dermatitidis ER-3]OAT01491.1 hypothetical protein BDCG_17106 [Blastomyces dermatitidis ER-3]
MELSCSEEVCTSHQFLDMLSDVIQRLLKPAYNYRRPPLHLYAYASSSEAYAYASSSEAAALLSDGQAYTSSEITAQNENLSMKYIKLRDLLKLSSFNDD